MNNLCEMEKINYYRFILILAISYCHKAPAHPTSKSAENPFNPSGVFQCSV